MKLSKYRIPRADLHHQRGPNNDDFGLGQIGSNCSMHVQQMEGTSSFLHFSWSCTAVGHNCIAVFPQLMGKRWVMAERSFSASHQCCSRQGYGLDEDKWGSVAAGAVPLDSGHSEGLYSSPCGAKSPPVKDSIC